ncbi:MAG: hypothetical protein AAF903_03815 [Pseudomonadota bacterium]
MKPFDQTITDLTRALQNLDAQNAFKKGVQAYRERRETELEAQTAHAQGMHDKRLVTSTTDNWATELRIQGADTDE